MRAMGPSELLTGPVALDIFYYLTMMWTIAGRRKANVLPDPVYAIPIRSLPLRAIVKANK